MKRKVFFVAVSFVLAFSVRAADLSYSASIFGEAVPGNDGSIDNAAPVTVTLSGDTFTGANGSNFIVAGKAATNIATVAPGLTAVITKDSDTQLSVTLTGNATNHLDEDDVADFTITFGDAAFTASAAVDVTNYDKSDLAIDFNDSAYTVTVTNVSELEAAINDNLVSDTTVSIADGTYYLTNTLNIGNLAVADDVIIRSQSGNRDAVMIYGEGLGVNSSGNVAHCFQLFDCENLVIRDLTVGQVYQHPISIQGARSCDYPSFINLRIVDGGEQLIKVNNDNGGPACDYGLVEDCLIEFTGYPYYWAARPGYYTHGIDVIGGGVGWILRGNTFKNFEPDPVHIAEAECCGPAILFWQSPSDILIEDNAIINCRQGIALGLADGEGVSNVVVRNNFFFNPSDISLADVAVTVRDSSNVEIYNNTAYLNDTYIPVADPVAIDYWLDDTTGLVIVNNLLDGEIYERTTGLNPTVFGNLTNAEAAWFSDTANGDLHLTALATDAIDGGAYCTAVTDDIDGEHRPMGNALDVGADEWSATVIPVLYFSDTYFAETAASNDGSIPTTVTINIQNDSFTGLNGSDFILAGKASSNASTVAPGLTAVLTKISATELVLSLSGNAANHVDEDDVSNLSLSFNDSALTGGDASALYNGDRSDLEIDFLNADGIVEVYRYVNTGSTSGGDGTTNATTGPNRAYASLSEWEAAEDKDLVAAAERMIVTCSGAAADTTELEIYDWNTSSDANIIIQTDAALSNSRHDGAWDSSAYRLEVDSVNPAVKIREDFVTLDGLQVTNANDDGDCIMGATNAGNNVIKNCVTNAGNAGIFHFGANATIYNCVVTGAKMTQDNCAGICVAGSNGMILNNTVYGCASQQFRGSIAANVSSTLVRNNISFNNDGDDYYGVGIKSYNISEDDTASGTGSIANVSFATTDQGEGDYVIVTDLTPGSEDFHLRALDPGRNVAIGGADNLSMVFEDDIDGETRPVSWDVGADQAPSLSSPPVLTADSVGNTVDNVMTITFADDPAWRAAISMITFDGADITAACAVTAGQISFDPSLDVDLQASKTASFAISAYGYYDSSVLQTIWYGAADHLSIKVQPNSPLTNGGNLLPQPKVAVADQYGNTVISSTATITAAKNDAGSWTLGGSTSGSAVNGLLAFTNLSATSVGAVIGAQLRFTAPGITAADSNLFDIPEIASYDWYVSASTGDDGTGDGSEGNPYASIGKAVTEASSGDAIHVDPGTYTETITIDKGLSIVGDDPATTIVQAAASYDTASDLVFNITADADVTLSHLTVRYGKNSATSGGGIRMAPSAVASMTYIIQSCEIVDNISNIADDWSRGGGGICVMPSNVAGCDLTVDVFNSTIAGNTASARGGGIFAFRNANPVLRVVIDNCTVYGNEAAGGGTAQAGGGVSFHNLTSGTVSRSTITGNTASGTGGGGGLGFRYGGCSITNTVIAGNTSVNTDTEDVAVYILPGTESNNVIGVNEAGGEDFTAGAPNANDSYIGTVASPVEVDLANLADNGGYTRTCAIPETSTAVNNGDYYRDANNLDQRGFYIQEGPLSIADIGAYEFGATVAGGEPYPFITITDDGAIYEGEEDGELIIVSLTDAVFADPVDPANWTVTNLPSGVVKGAVTRVDDSTVSITLSGDRDTDYDTDITNVTVECSAAEHSGDDSLSASSGVIISAMNEEIRFETAAFHESLSNDGTIDDSDPLTITLSDETFSGTNGDDFVADGKVTVSNVPPGLTAVVTRDNDIRVSVTLTGAAFDHDHTDDIHDLSITFLDGAFTHGIASGVVNNSKSDLSVYFEGVVSTSYLNPVQDAFVDIADATGNYGSDTTVYTQGNNSNTPQEVALMQFDLSSIPSDVVVISATLRVYCDSDEGASDPEHGGMVTVQGVNDAWTEGTVTFNTVDGSTQWMGSGTINENGALDGYASAADSIDNHPYTHPDYVAGQFPGDDWDNGDHLVEFDITDMAGDWIDGTTTNNGLAVCANAFFPPTYYYGYYQIGWASRESANPPELEISYYLNPPPEIRYSGDTFYENAANDGSIDNTSPIVITLVDDTESFTGSNGDDFVAGGKVAVSNMSSGLTAVVTRMSATELSVTITGNAAAHNTTDDISDLTFSFQDSAFQSSLAADVIDSEKTDLAISFIVNPDPFIVIADDGGIVEGEEDGEIISVTLTNAVFTDPLTPANWTVSNLPAGVSKGAVTRIDDTHATITLSGDRTADYDADITNASVQCTADEHSGDSVISANTGVVFTASTETMTYSRGTFYEDFIANDGTIDNSSPITITLLGDSFSGVNGTDIAANVTVNNMPAGLTAVFIKDNGGQVSVSLTGAAASHEDLDSISNLEFIFQDAAFDHGVASGVTNYNKSDLIVDFNNGISTVSLNPIKDSYVDVDNPAVNYGANTGLVIKGGNNETPLETALMQFDVSTIAAGTVMSATLRLYCAADNGDDEEAGGEVTIQGVNDAWTEGTVTFNTVDGTTPWMGSGTITENGALDGYASAATSTENRPYTHPGYVAGQYPGDDWDSGTHIVEFDITGLVEDWVDGNRDNNGLAVCTNAYFPPTYYYGWQEITWASRESANQPELEITYYGTPPPEPELTYSGSAFYESSANDGTIDNAAPITISLVDDTFTGSNGDDFVAAGKVVVGNMPSGLTAVVTRMSATELSVTISGTAASHEASDSIANLSFTFQNSAFDGGSAADVADYAKSDLSVSFTDAATIGLADDGGITEGAEDGEVITVTLSGGSFTDPLTPANWTVSNLPAGVSRGAVARIDDTHATITLSGDRTADYDTDITNVTVECAAAEHSDPGVLSANTGVTLTALVEDINYSGVSFSEDLINDGTIGNTIIVTLTDDSFTGSNGDDFVAGGKVVVSNMPSGLTAVLTRMSATELSVTISGAAASHDESDSISNLTFTFQNTAFVGGNAAFVDNYAKSDLSVEFNDGVASASFNPVKDSYVDSAAATTNYGTDATVYMKGGNSETPSEVALMQFDVSTIAAGTVMSATLRLYCAADNGDDEEAGGEVTIQGVNDAWTEGTVTFNTVDGTTPWMGSGTITENGALDGYASAATSTENRPYTHPGYVAGQYPGDDWDSGTHIVEFDITGLVEDWVDGNRDNNGLAVCTNAYFPPTYYYGWQRVGWASRESANQPELEVTYYGAPPAEPELTYSGSAFYESSANDGTIDNAAPITISLVDDIFTGSNGDDFVTDGKVVVGDMPSGLTAVITRMSATELSVTISGTAASHEASDSIANLSFTFQNSAFDGGSAADVADYAKSDLSVSFTDAATIGLADDGGITEGAEDGEVITVTLSGGSFTDPLTPANWTVSNLPAGVSRGAVARIDDTHATITLSGDRTADYDTDITNVTVECSAAEHSDPGVLSANTGVTLTALVESLTYPSSTFTESVLNDGSITNTIVVSLANDSFTGLNGADFVGDGKVLVSNLPSGLTAVITRMSATELSITLSGNADNHEDIDDVSDLTLTFQDGAFADGPATAIDNYAKSDFAVDFNDPLVTTDFNPVEDAFVDSGNPTVNHGSDTTVYMRGSGNSNTPYEVSLMRFDLSTIPGGAFIHSATLTMYCDSDMGDSSEHGGTVTIQGVNDAWTEGTVTFDTVNGSTPWMGAGSIIENGALDGFASAVTSTENRPYTHPGYVAGQYPGDDWNTGDHLVEFDITDLVGDWIDGTRTNNGLAVCANDYLTPYTYGYYRAGWASRESANQPQLEISYYGTPPPDPAIAYDSDTFNEAAANDGTIDNASPITISLVDDTFTGSNGEDFVAAGKVVVSNMPSGLTAVITRMSATELSVTISGAAASHEASDSVFNLTFSFQDSAFATYAAADVTGYTKSDLNMDFDDPLLMSIADDGSIIEGAEDGEVITVTLSGAILTDPLTPANWTVSNLPAGVSWNISRTDDTHAAITLSGDRTADYDSDITNVTVECSAAETDSGQALSANSGVVLTAAVEELIYSSSGFNEAIANDGTIDNSSPMTISLAGESLAGSNGDDFVGDGKVVVSNLPSGLTAVITRMSANELSVTITGAAVAHETIDSVSNLSFTFQDAAFETSPASFVDNYGKSDLTVSFYDTVHEVTLNPVQDSFVDSGSPDVNYGSGSSVYMIGNNSENPVRAALMKFDFAAIPLGANVVSATLRLYCVDDLGDDEENGGTVTIQGVNDDWTEAGVSFNTTDGSTQWMGAGSIAENGSLDGYASAATSTANYPYTHPNYTAGEYPGDDWNTGSQLVDFDITGLVSDWVDSTRDNYGLALCATGYFPPTYLYGYSRFEMTSREGANRPQLIINYLGDEPIPALSYIGTGFSEELVNDGSINNDTPVTISLVEDSFTGSNGDDFVAAGKIIVTNLSSGLTAVATRTSASQISLTLTGNAAAHAAADSVSNLTLTFQDSAFNGGDASAVTNYSRSDLTIDFNDPTSDFFVSQSTGNDTTGDGSSGNPYASIAKAVESCVGGETIEIVDAVHTEAGITIDKGVTITGYGAAATTVRAHASYDSASDRVFSITAAADVTIMDMTIRHGKTASSGGCLNMAPSAPGNYVYTIDSCAIVDNITSVGASYASGGGGIRIWVPETAGYDLTVMIVNSTIAGNASDSRGGGVFAIRNGPTSAPSSLALAIENCTIADNTANGTDSGTGGGVALHNNTATVYNSTITGNTVSGTGGGGGLAGRYAGMTVANSIIAGNTAASVDSEDFFRSGGSISEEYNVIGVNEAGDSDLTSGLPNGNDSHIGTIASPVDALLGTLQDNGGQTETCAIGGGSPAVRLIPRGSEPYYNDSPAEDQRGFWIDRWNAVPDGENDYNNRAAGAYWYQAGPTPARGFKGRSE